MQRLPGILLHVDARQADAQRPAAHGDVEAAAERKRPFVLRDLIALRQVGIEVVLPREDGQRLHVATQGNRGLDCVIDGGSIEDRQGARKPEADRAHLRIRRRAERRAAAAEDLRAGLQLRVNLQADNRLELHRKSQIIQTKRRFDLGFGIWDLHLGSGCLDGGIDVLLERLEVLDEHAGKLLRLLVIRVLVRPRGPRGSSTLSGTPGHVVGMSRLKIESF